MMIVMIVVVYDNNENNNDYQKVGLHRHSKWPTATDTSHWPGNIICPIISVLMNNDDDNDYDDDYNDDDDKY